MEGGDSDGSGCHRRNLSCDVAIDMFDVDGDESDAKWFQNRRKTSTKFWNKFSNGSNTNYGSPYGHNQQMGDAAVETENDRLTDKLKGQIGSLRSLAIDIGSEVTGQNKYMREMDDDFDRAGGFLGKSMNRVKKLASGSHNHVVLYLVIFSLFVFLFIWFII